MENKQKEEVCNDKHRQSHNQQQLLSSQAYCYISKLYIYTYHRRITAQAPGVVNILTIILLLGMKVPSHQIRFLMSILRPR